MLSSGVSLSEITGLSDCEASMSRFFRVNSVPVFRLTFPVYTSFAWFVVLVVRSVTRLLPKSTFPDRV